MSVSDFHRPDSQLEEGREHSSSVLDSSHRSSLVLIPYAITVPVIVKSFIKCLLLTGQCRLAYETSPTGSRSRYGVCNSWSDKNRPKQASIPFSLEKPGKPSKMITLNALKVLSRYWRSRLRHPGVAVCGPSLACEIQSLVGSPRSLLAYLSHKGCAPLARPIG